MTDSYMTHAGDSSVDMVDAAIKRVAARHKKEERQDYSNLVDRAKRRLAIVRTLTGGESNVPVSTELDEIENLLDDILK